MDDFRRILGAFFIITQVFIIETFSNEILISVKLGYRTTLPCRLLEKPYGTVSWMRGKERLTYGMSVLVAKTRMDVQSPGPREWNLAINNVIRDDEGLYNCTVGNDAVSRVRLRVTYMPTIVNDGSTKNAIDIPEFTNVTLTCKTKGYPEPEVTWFRESLDKTTTDLGVSGKSLTIVNITRYGADTYICKASNTEGSARRYMHVTVNFYPEVTVYQKVIYALTSEDVLMTCEVQGQPLTSFYWETNLKQRVEKSTWKYVFNVTDLPGYPVRFLTLMIRSNTWNKTEYGNYTCVANKATARVELKNRNENE